MLEVRTFAHCSKLTKGAVVFAVAVSPCVRNETLDLDFKGATKLTAWWLSARSPSDDMISLNGKNLTVYVDGPLPSLDGMPVSVGDSYSSSVTMPTTGVCTVGFVEAQYSSPVAACQ
jgi:hypothetical protein|eukprot:COSAG06_NODE_3578_length_5160_cov_13.296779_2_plen_117_part_00